MNKTAVTRRFLNSSTLWQQLCTSTISRQERAKSNFLLMTVNLLISVESTVGLKNHPGRLATVSLLLGFLIGLPVSCVYFPLKSKGIDSARANLHQSINLCNETIPLESPSV